MFIDFWDLKKMLWVCDWFFLALKTWGVYFYCFDGGERSELQMSGISLLLLSLRTKAKQTQMRFITCTHQRRLQQLCIPLLFPTSKFYSPLWRSELLLTGGEDLFRCNCKTLWDPEMRSVLKLNPMSSEAQKDILNIWGKELACIYCKITTELHRVNVCGKG